MRTALVVATTVLVLTFASAAAATAQRVAAPAVRCEVIDLMPAFWRYLSEAGGQEPGEQVRIFDRLVRTPNADVYEAVFRGLPVAAGDLVPKATAASLAMEPTLRALSTTLADDLPRQLASFQRTFPDFRCELPVYFLFAAGAFDGATRRIHDRPALLFGLDVIARVHGERLAPLVIHELFHVHHDAVVPGAPDRFYWALWKEGLATLASRRLNPGVPEAQVCCLPDMEAVPRERRRLAAYALTLLDSERREDYARYFLGGSTDIPARSGYYLGYRVAEAASRGRTLADLARLSPREVRAIVERTLAAMH